MNETLTIAVAAGFASLTLLLGVALLTARARRAGLTAMTLAVSSLVTAGTLGDTARLTGIGRTDAWLLGSPLLIALAVLGAVCMQHSLRPQTRDASLGDVEDLTDTTKMPVVRQDAAA